MENKNKILIASGVLLITVIVVIFFYILSKSKVAPQANVLNTNNLSTGTGSVGGVLPVSQPPAPTPVPTTDSGRSNPISFTDPTQPFATTLPRQQAPPKPRNPAVKKNNNQPAATPTIDPGDITNPDYTQLSDSQFLAKYYPNYQSVIDGTTAADFIANAQDPVLINTSSSQASLTAIPDNPNVSTNLFKVSSDNSQAAYNAYIQNLSDSTTDFDLVHDTTLFTEVLNTLDPKQISSLKQKSQLALDKIRGITVPENMLGLQKDYYQHYQQYQGYLDDLSTLVSLNGSQDPAQLQSQAGILQNDVTTISAGLNNINQDIETARIMLGGLSIGANAQ